MNVDRDGALVRRAAVHRALGEVHRLAIVEALRLTDLTPGELAERTGLGSNLLGFHLGALEAAGIVHRRRSDGDGRRRYVSLVLDSALLDEAVDGPDARRPLFVCTRNSARSQLAAALWGARTGRPANSAGSRPALEIHPHAVAVARAHGLDLGAATPVGYGEVSGRPTVVVSVCDRAAEQGVPFTAPRLHWSVPDPVGRRRHGFEDVFAQIAARVDRLAQVAT